MIVERLSQATLDDAINLAHSVFDYLVSGPNPPELALRASLNTRDGQTFLRREGIERLEYYVAREDATGMVVGLIGAYELVDDPPETVWVGWFCVRQGFRGQGLGEMLLQGAIQRAQASGYNVMRLYTSEHPNEAPAQVLYEKLGFKITRTQAVPGKSYRLLFRERAL